MDLFPWSYIHSIGQYLPIPRGGGGARVFRRLEEEKKVNERLAAMIRELEKTVQGLEGRLGKLEVRVVVERAKKRVGELAVPTEERQVGEEELAAKIEKWTATLERARKGDKTEEK